MINAIRRSIARFRGSGSSAITLPPMDGAMRPNERLERARLVVHGQQPNNLQAVNAELWFTRGAELWRVADPDTGAPKLMANLRTNVSCLAADSDGNVVAGFEDGRVNVVWGPRRGQVLSKPSFDANCPTAMVFNEGTLYVCHGSSRNAPSQWKRDLMQREASGSVWRIEFTSQRSERVADGLAYPCGIALGKHGQLVVSEAWRHRLIHVPMQDGRLQTNAVTPVLSALPGYPGRISPAGDDGFWLCVFAPRSRLVEFVLSERSYCMDMLRDVDSEHWIAPALKSGYSFLEPLQGGGVKQMGILKPWAPARSYGLLVRLDVDFQPVESLHSRADGTRHGLTACVQVNGRVMVSSWGGDAILEIV